MMEDWDMQREGSRNNRPPSREEAVARMFIEVVKESGVWMAEEGKK